MNSHRMPSRPRVPRHGVTLIEVLVTMVLLGVGLLGLAGLQARGLQVNQGSTYRAQAANLAVDLADRLRVDPATTMKGTYSGAYTPTAAANNAVLPLVQDWMLQLGTLPGGSATVAVAAPTVTVTVSWDDTRASNGAQPGAGPSIGNFVLTTEISN